LVLRLNQKDTLQAVFQQNPYPGIATRERLSRELGIAESRIQIWFQNRRARHPKQSASGPVNALAKGPDATSAVTAPSDQRAAFRCCVGQPSMFIVKRTFITPSQTRVLVQAFERDRFPSIAAREELAHQTGIPEPRIQIWFQNRRARHPKQSASGPVNALAEGPDATSAVTAPSREKPPRSNKMVTPPSDLSYFRMRDQDMHLHRTSSWAT
ncbi:double homeobox protein 1-like, partial [Mesoplodon densirostris]|uniref:double homeobox protein 1-like n=1 Tax=Mesoplodon densirostris TaxID=48708 RepID=UPI0028DBD46E